MQSLDKLDTLHYSLRGPASGNTSLPDVDSSRFAGCTSGARTITSSRGLLGACWGPPGGLLGASLGFFWTFWGPLPPPSFSYSLPIIPSSAGSNHGRRRDQLPPGWRCAAVRPGGKITLRSSRCVAFWGLLWGLLEASWGLLGGLLGASWGPLGASWWPLGASWGRLGPSLAVSGRFCAIWPFRGPSWGPLAAALGPSWGPLGPS